MRLLKLYTLLIWTQIRTQLQYRASFLTNVVSTFLVNGSYFFGLYLILERFKEIQGWTITELAFVAGMAEMGFGMMDMIFSGFDPDFFSPFVRQGKFDQLLLRPVPISLQVLGSRFVMSRLGRIFEGAILLAIGIGFAAPQWTLWKTFYLPVVVASNVLGMGALFIAGATLTFWTIQPIEAVNIVTYGGNEVMSYPITIYPNWIRRFFTYILPLAFLNYFPALFFLGKPYPYNLPPILSFAAPLAAGLMFFAAMKFWNYGRMHYQSTGT